MTTQMKCIAYHAVEAVEDDTRTVVRFMPGEVRDVKDDQVQRFLDRYPDMLEVFDAKAVAAAQEEAEAKLKAPNKEEDDKSKRYICDVCGFTAKSSLGLMSHTRKHDKGLVVEE
jgi:rubrerythrin